MILDIFTEYNFLFEMRKERSENQIGALNGDIWKFIHQELTAGERVMLMVVAEVRDSTPGRPGYKMAVSGNGRLMGSIGGGMMEYNMVNLARDLLKQSGAEPMAIRQVHNPDAGRENSGLLCAGMQVNLLFPLEKVHLEVIGAIAATLDEGHTGNLVIRPDLFGFSPLPISENRISWEMQAEDEWAYSEEMGLRPVLHVFGGGHLSVPLSKVFRMLGFKVLVFDDREQLNTMENNDFAHEKRVIDYRNAADYLNGGDHAYVAIMTVSHAADQVILAGMLQKKLKYLGMIGSRKKVDKIFGALLANGATPEQLARVDSPMGIDIGSQTVEEIAVSIAAKVIQVKNNI